jgi:hypothetical protein
MNTIKAISPGTSTAIMRSLLSQDPRFAEILSELQNQLPKSMIQQAEVFEEWVLDAVMDELKTSIEQIDAVALANALLSNKVLQGKLAVPLNGIANEFIERFKAVFKEQIHNETTQIHNLLAARKAKDKADNLKLMKKRDDLKLERDVAIAKGELLWLRISALHVAVPSLVVAVIVGLLIGINYPMDVKCVVNDPICGLRIGLRVRK